MAVIQITLSKCRCKEAICPFSGSGRTPGEVYADDYFCKKIVDKTSVHGFKTTSGYVEWDKDVNPVPDWCPIRIDDPHMGEYSI